MKRKYPPKFQELFDLAKAAGLSYPKGRALYLCNRLWNGDNNRWVSRGPLVRMKTIRPDTAKRWMRHWASGGHIQSLRSVEEQNAARRKRAADHRAFLKKFPQYDVQKEKTNETD